jgi:hypothetical protein
LNVSWQNGLSGLKMKLLLLSDFSEHNRLSNKDFATSEKIAFRAVNYNKKLDA